MRIKIKHENKIISFNAKQDIRVKDLIKALKNNIQLNLKNEEIILMDETQNIIEEEKILKIIPQIKLESENNNITIELTKNDDFQLEKELYLSTFKKTSNPKFQSTQEFFEIKNENSVENRNKLNQISDLIQKATNAKEKINVQETKPLNKTVDRFRIFEDLLSNNLGGLMGQRGGPLASQANQINELLNILRPMIENDVPESSTSNSSNNRHNIGVSTGSNIFRPLRVSSQRVIPDENLINNLKEMGFPEEQCRRALIHARNDISRATDLLLSDGLDYLPDGLNNNNANSNNNNNQNQINNDQESDGGFNDDQGMDEIGHDEEMSDIPNNIFSVNINDLNNHDIMMNDEFSDNVLSENVNININYINPNQNPQNNTNNTNNNNNNNNSNN